ncbi:MAG TPA: hypothetical protein VFS64_04720 [Solirubrobacterales bacterium]|nr:hypothetical protein [Solirubrobacterales bacterium]
MAAPLSALLVVAALIAGCGESRHANEQRPQVSTRVSVTISPGEVIVQPGKVAFGPERDKQIPQNQNHAQPPIKTRKPLDLTLVTANQTTKDTQLKIRGSKEAESGTIYAHSPGTYGVELPAGSYTIYAVGMPGAQPGHLTVGSYRASSQNDVLLP